MFNSKENPMFIGFFGGWVWLTYLGVISACFGIYNALHDKVWLALICLLVAGLCDAFDGKIASKFKRSNEEKQFGVQIDALCDAVSFLILPTIICYGMKLSTPFHIFIYITFVLCGIVRLAYFNIVAEKSGDKAKGTFYYHGLPVTSSSIIFPLIYLTKLITNVTTFETIYILMMAFVALLFILNFKLKNPSNFWKYIFLGFVIIMTGVFVYLGVIK